MTRYFHITAAALQCEVEKLGLFPLLPADWSVVFCAWVETRLAGLQFSVRVAMAMEPDWNESASSGVSEVPFESSLLV